MHSYDLLISKLDAFIRKYYADKLIKGSLVFLISLLLFILTVSVGEYYLYMPVWVRITIAALFVLCGLTALVVWVVIPLTKMARLGKVISHEQAAAIIGTHFPEVSDKLLNILQLKRQHDSHASKELIEASINQKSKQLVSVPIVSAIDLSKNRRYMPYLLPLLLVGIFILVAAPNVFRDASERLLQPTKSFEKPAPFRFVLKNKELKAIRNTDYVIDVTTEGESLPLDMSVAIGDDLVPMAVNDKNSFSYTFRNVTDKVEFRLYAAGFYSQPHILKVVQKPVLKTFKIYLDYPAYTGRKDEAVNSLGDMTVPVGTSVSWTFNTEYTDKALLKFGSEEHPLNKKTNSFSGNFRFLRDTAYTLVLQNNKTAVSDSFQYYVSVIPDEYPVLQLQEYRDTVSGKQVLLNGSAGDDYGVSKVQFHYSVTDEQNNELAKNTTTLKTTPGVLTTFQHYFDIETLNLLPGQKVSYYIEAWDNDDVHGSKATRSELMTYRMFDKNQLDSAINANAKQINSGLSNSSQQAEKLQNEYKEMQSRLLKSNDFDWEQKQSLQNMMKMQHQLQNEMEAVKKRFEEQLQQSKQKEYSEEVREKQEDLKEQMANLMDKELQEQMKKLEELMKKLNKEQALQTMQQMQQKNKLFDMDMKRMKELMKKLEMQMRMEDMANKMKELAEKEMALAAKTEEKKESNELLNKEQEAIKKELEDAMAKDMADIKRLNEQMENPQKIDDNKQAAEQAEQEMQKGQQQLQKNNNSGASKSQQNAAKSLQQMAASFSMQSSDMDMQTVENIQMVRQLLSNLMRLSFDQEQLMADVRESNVASRNYVANQQEQKRLHENSKMIRDSLFVLSKKLFKLSATINKETTELEQNMNATVNALENRRIGDAMTRQQYVMTHTNNLALMLNEVLQNLMQMQNASQNSSSSGMCKKPGGKKPGAGKQLSDVITQQESLGSAMEQYQRSKAQNGSNSEGKKGDPKGNKEGEQKSKQGGQGEYGDAEKLARMAQQQAAIRRQIRELNSLLNSKGMSDQAKELREIQEEMDRTETDLVNRKFNSELLARQREILTRLLEAEKAVREQQQDDKRSSKTAQQINRPVPPELEKHLDDQKQLTEQYKTLPPVLKPYYKQIVEEYNKILGTK